MPNTLLPECPICHGHEGFAFFVRPAREPHGEIFEQEGCRCNVCGAEFHPDDLDLVEESYAAAR